MKKTSLVALAFVVFLTIFLTGDYSSAQQMPKMPKAKGIPIKPLEDVMSPSDACKFFRENRPEWNIEIEEENHCLLWKKDSRWKEYEEYYISDDGQNYCVKLYDVPDDAADYGPPRCTPIPEKDKIANINIADSILKNIGVGNKDAKNSSEESDKKTLMLIFAFLVFIVLVVAISTIINKNKIGKIKTEEEKNVETATSGIKFVLSLIIGIVAVFILLIFYFSSALLPQFISNIIISPIFIVLEFAGLILAITGAKSSRKGFSIFAITLNMASIIFWVVFVMNIKSVSPQIEQPKQERKIVALGSSLSKATNYSLDKRGDWENMSFSTGTELNSVYKYLTSKGENLTPKNLASSGADTKEILEKQAVNVSSFSPKYITLDPGADILSGSEANFRSNLDKIFGKIQGGDTKIMVMTYPDFIKMRTASYASCKEDKFGYRVKNLAQAKIQSFNKAIIEIAGKYNATVVDLYPILGSEDVSELDCLHPNASGINKISQEFIKKLQ